MSLSVHRLRCTGCSVRIDGAQAQSNFRCVECGDLFEVEYAWSAGAVWPDGRAERFDAVVWATGFRPEVGHLAPLNLRSPGGGIRLDGTRAVADPRVHLVGYGPSASTVGANRAGRAAAVAVDRLLAAAPGDATDAADATDTSDAADALAATA